MLTILRDERALVARRDFLRMMGTGAFALSGAALLAGCGGGGHKGSKGGTHGGGPSGPTGDAGVPGGGKEGTALSNEEKVAAMAAVVAAFESLANGAASCDPAALVAALAKLPQFSRVGTTSDGNVWLRCTDGMPMVVGNNLRTKGSPAKSAKRKKAKSRGDAITGNGVPTGELAAVFKNFTQYPAWGDNGLYTADDAPNDYGVGVCGYDLAPSAILGPTVDNLKDLKDIGFMSWFTHGGYYMKDGTMDHALLTYTDATLETLIQYLPDINAGNIVAYAAPTDYAGGGDKWSMSFKFGITPAFIRNYGWSFKENSMALISACASDFEGFKDAFKAAGVSLYGGWTKPVLVFKAGMALSSLVDGVIAYDDQGVIPAMRPMDVADVKSRLDELEMTKYEDPKDGTVEFVLTPFKDDASVLRPSLQRTVVDESEGTLILAGSFGSKQGEVWIGAELKSKSDLGASEVYYPGVAMQLDVISWAEDEIVCRFPMTAGGGYVGVKVGNRWSNPRSVTIWKPTIKISGQGPGQIQAAATVDLVIRADVGPWYERWNHETLTNAPAAIQVGNAEGTSKCTFDLSGSYQGSASLGKETFSWVGEGEIAAKLPADPRKNLTAVGQIDALGNKAKLTVSAADFGVVKMRHRITAPDGEIVDDQTLSFSLGDLINQKEIAMNDDLVMLGGSYNASQPFRYLAGMPNATMDYVVSWSNVVPSYKPDPRVGC